MSNFYLSLLLFVVLIISDSLTYFTHNCRDITTSGRSKYSSSATLEYQGKMWVSTRKQTKLVWNFHPERFENKEEGRGQYCIGCDYLVAFL